MKKTLTTLAFLAILLPSPLFAAGTLPFGGRITGPPIYCTCTAGHVVMVGPPRAGRYHYVPGSTRLYQFHNVNSPGTWLLGNYIPGTGNACYIRIRHHCQIIPNKGIISIVGTS